MKKVILFITGTIGMYATYIFGEWSGSMITLCVCMVADFVLGLIVAGIFSNSKKTNGGGLSSQIAFKGLARKVCILILVAVGYWIDNLLNINYVRDGIIWAYVINELLSIVENIGLCGVPLPTIITKVIEILKTQEKTEKTLETPVIIESEETKQDE